MKQKVSEDLRKYLESENQIGKILPSCPDIEELWKKLATSYLPDGIREFQKYPVSSLGWMMFIGMAVATFWDGDWNIYSQIDDLYLYMRNKRGYDSLDDYIKEEVLLLNEKEAQNTDRLVGECASRTNNMLRHAHIEPGTKEAFKAYTDCLELLYYFGAAIQLHRMGYQMVKSEG